MIPAGKGWTWLLDSPALFSKSYNGGYWGYVLRGKTGWGWMLRSQPEAKPLAVAAKEWKHPYATAEQAAQACDGACVIALDPDWEEIQWPDIPIPFD